MFWITRNSYIFYGMGNRENVRLCPVALRRQRRAKPDCLEGSDEQEQELPGKFSFAIMSGLKLKLQRENTARIKTLFIFYSNDYVDCLAGIMLKGQIYLC